MSEQRREGLLRLKACEVCTETDMATATERLMMGVFARNVEAVGVGVDRRVAVCSGEGDA